jgi:hypothetical protein
VCLCARARVCVYFDACVCVCSHLASVCWPTLPGMPSSFTTRTCGTWAGAGASANGKAACQRVRGELIECGTATREAEVADCGKLVGVKVKRWLV